MVSKAVPSHGWSEQMGHLRLVISGKWITFILVVTEGVNQKRAPLYVLHLNRMKECPLLLKVKKITDVGNYLRESEFAQETLNL